MCVKKLTDNEALEALFSKEAHERTIEVLIKDKETGQIVGSKTITRGALAKAFQPLTDTPVLGAQNGKFILEI